MNTNSARSKRTKSHRSSQYDCPDSAGAATAAASRSAAACSRRRDPAAAAAISSRSSATARRGGGAHCAGACSPSARGANGRRAHVAARPHPREGLRLHVTAVGGRWRPLAAVGRGLPLWQPPSALCSSVRAASGSLRRDLGGNKRSPLAVSAPWRAGGLLEQTERPPWEDTQGKPACPRKLVAARTPSGSVEEFMHAVGFKARNCIKNSKKRSCTACTAF